MRVFIPVLLLLSSGLYISCSDCNDCTPFTEEPYLSIRFLNKADSSKKIIVFDTVNQVFAKDLRHFQDTTSEFKFPLDMHHDTSVFDIVYRDTTNIDTLKTNRITIVYLREFLRREDNYIVVECDIQSFSSGFLIDTLKCKESSSLKCKSNEAIATIYN